MDILNVIVGVVMIGLGFLVKRAPNLIAGYNTLSDDEKSNVDIDGLSTMMRNGLIIIGLVVIMGYWVFKGLGFPLVANSMILITTLPGTMIMVIMTRKYYHNQQKKTTSAIIITALVFAGVLGLLTYGSQPSRVTFTNVSIRFSGMYGLELDLSEVEDVRLIDTLPPITRRTNGFSFGMVKKGHFKLKRFGKVRLLVHCDKPPYLIIFTNDEQIICNFKEHSQTEEVFEKIRALRGEINK